MTSVFQRLTALFFFFCAAQKIVLGPVSALKVKAGDTVVISHPGVLNRQKVDAIRAHVLAAMPDGVRALVLCGGLTLQVISGGATNDDQPSKESGCQT